MKYLVHVPLRNSFFSECLLAARQAGRGVLLLAIGFSALPLFVAAQATLEERTDRLLDSLSTRSVNVGQYDGPHRSGRTGFWTTEGRLTRSITNSTTWYYLSDAIRNADGSEDAGGANGGFSGWPGMDCWYRFNHLFPQNIKDQYYTEFTTMPTYHNGSTPNQKMMWAAACRLACEYWGTNTATSVSDADYLHTGDKTGRDYIISRCAFAVKYSFEERWAKHYLTYTMGPLRSVSDFTKDEELARIARMTVDWGFADLAPVSFNGRWAVPAGRGSMTGDGNSYDISEFNTWLLMGGPVPASLLDADQSCYYIMPGAPNPTLQHDVVDIGTNRAAPYTTRRLARLFETQFATTYMTKDYALYSEVEGDTTLNPDGSIVIKDLNNNGVPSNDWASERWAVLWDDAPDYGKAGLTMKPPTDYGWAIGSGLSPYEDVVQHEGTIVGILNIPDDKNQYTKDTIPTNVLAVINETATGTGDKTGWLFLHYKTVLVAIYRTDTAGFQYPAPSTSACMRRGFAVETAEVTEYPQAAAVDRLAAFRDDILTKGGMNTNFVQDVVNNRMIYTNRLGRALEITYGEGGKIDGAPVDYVSWPLSESPWTYQAQVGQMFVFGTDRTVVSDYTTWTVKTNNRPTIVSTASTNTVAGAPVEIDLAKRVADGETLATNLHFRVMPSSAGLAELLADGHTVRFTPAAQRVGVASIAFSGTDIGLDHRTVFRYDFEQTPVVLNKTVQDVSGCRRPATSATIALGSLLADTSVPSLRGTPSMQSLRMTSSSLGSAKLSRQIYPANLNMPNASWTFATWFRRADYADDDFLFYIGSGDGFGGDGDELQLYCPAQAKKLLVRHYNAANAQDVSISSSAVIDTNSWHHAALVFDRIGHQSGHVTLYLDGAVAATVSNVTWNLKLASPLFIGGTASSTVMSRDFNGWIDETTLFRGALASDEITRLTEASSSHLGGLSVSGTIDIGAVAAPAAPTGLAASNSGLGGGNRLTWSTVDDATSYSVKRGLSGNGPFVVLASGLASPTYTDAAAGTNAWFYVVSASNSVGESPDSLAVATALPPADPTIWSSGLQTAWSHGLRLNFSGLVDGAATTTNLPLLVRLSTNLTGFAYTQFGSSTGAGLRFTDAAGMTELPYEIDVWNTNGTSSVWVRVPVLSTATNICVFWGNPSASPSVGSVWSQDFLGVWHLGETSGVHRDSSPRLASSELIRVTQQGTAAGIVGGTDRFDGSDDYVDLPSMGWSSNVTVECWAKLDGVPTTTTHGLVSSDLWSAGVAHFRADNALGLNVALNGSGSISRPDALTTGSWFHAAYTVAGAGASGLSLYLDGTRLATAAGVISNNLTDVNIAREYSGRYLKGWVDEVRISSVARSEAWLRATWRNLAESAAYTVCSAVTPRTPALPVVAVASATVVTATTATLNGTLLSTGTVIEVRAYWGQTDGGMTPSAWSNSVSLGARSYGAFSSAITGLVPGSLYYARFWATNSAGAAWSPTASVFASLPPAPTTLTAVGTAGQVAFSWDAVAGATDYTLARSTVSGGPYTSMLTGIQTTHALDLTAQTGFTYYYVVRAAKNGVESADSAQVVVSPVSMPSDVVASPGNGAVALAWTAVSGATGYTVNRATVESGPYIVVQSGITATTFSDTGRSNGTRYWYTVHATAAGFVGAPCAAVSAVPQTAQAAPSGLAAIPLNTSAQLTWNSAADATSYTLKRGTSAVGPFSTVASGLLVSPQTDTGLSNGTTYYYVVSTLYGATASTNSAPVAVIPAVPPTVFVTPSPGDWSDAVWSPSLPWAGSTVKVIFTNASSISSTNNLGPFLLNTLILTNQAVTLRGDLLFLAGTAPSVRTIQNGSHLLDLPLYVDAATTFSVPAGTLTLDGVVDGQGGVTKSGAGSLVFNQVNSYTGGTTLDGGSLVCAVGPMNFNSLAFGEADGSPATSTLTLNAGSATASSLTLRNNSTTANTITLGANHTLTVNGAVALGTYTTASTSTSKLTVSGSGSLVFAGSGASCRVGTASSGSGVATTLDLSGLSTFEMQGLTSLEIGNGPLANTMILAANSTVRVGTIKLANYQVNNYTATLKLGSGTNALYADQLSLGTSASPYGGGRGDGTIMFNGAGGSLSLRSLDETGAELLLGASGTGGNGIGVFNVAGHTCDLWLSRLAMGQSDNVNGGQSFNFDRGTLRIDTAQIGIAQVSTVTLGGGYVTIGLLDTDTDEPGMGSFSLAGAGAGTLTLTGGTNTFFCPLLKSGAGIATLNLNGANAVLDMQGFDIGTNTLPINAFTFTAGTLRDCNRVHGGIALAGTGRRTFEQDLYAGSITSVVSGVAGLLKSGTNTLTLTAGNIYSGTTAIAGGMLVVPTVTDSAGCAIGLATNVADALTFSNSGTLLFTGTSGSTARTLRSDAGGGVFDIPTGCQLSLNTGNLVASATVAGWVGDGGLTKRGAGELILGNNRSGSIERLNIGSGNGGDFTLHDGTLRFAPTKHLTIGESASGHFLLTGGTASFEPTGGNVANNDVYLANAASTSTGRMTVAGGSFFATNALSQIRVGQTGTGFLTIGGGTNAATVTTPKVQLGSNGATSGGTLTLLTNGTLVVGSIVKGPGSGSLTIAGGTLRARVDQAAFLTGLTSATIGMGGATIDSAGFAVTMGQLFSGVGGLTKTGNGTLTLSGANSYAGHTIVSNGTLLVSTTGAIGTGDLTVAAGAICGLRNTGDGVANSATVYLSASAQIDLGTGVNETVDRLVIDGHVCQSGIWNATRDPIHFTGTGNLVVSVGIPDAPTSLTATPGTTSITIAWSAPASAIGYIVRRATALGGPFINLATTASTAFIDSSTAVWTRYWYVVAATNTYGMGPDSASDDALITSTNVTLAASDPLDWTSFNLAGRWNSGAAPQTGYRYFTGPYLLRTPNASTTSLTFGGDGLTINGNGGMLMFKGTATSGTTVTINQLTLAGGLLRNGVNNPWTLAGSIVLASNSVYAFQQNVVTTLAAELSGTGGLSTTNTVTTDTLALSGLNSSWSGGLTYNGGGKLALNSAAALGTGRFTISTRDGAAALDNTSAADLALTTTMQQSWAGNFTFLGTRSLDLGTGAITLTGNRAITVSSNTLSAGGAIVDGGSGFALTKNGAGMLALAGDNTYGGATTVAAGELRLRHNSALGSVAGQTTVADGARLSLDNSVTILGEAVTLAGMGIDQFGALRSISGYNVWAGPMVIGSTGTQIGALDGTLAIAGPIDDAASSFDLLIRNGTGLTVLAATNTYGGATQILNGQVRLGAPDVLPATTTLKLGTNNLAGNLDLNGFNQTVSGLLLTQTSGTFGSYVTNSSASTATLTIDLAANDQTYSGVLAGLLALNKTGSGTLTLSATNSYIGNTTINGGRLAATSPFALGPAGRTVTIGAGSTLELASDTSMVAYVLSLSSGGTMTNRIGRATLGSAISHTLGSAALGNSTLVVEAGDNLTDGVPELRLTGLSLSAGVAGQGTVTLNPTTARLVVTGGITRPGSQASSLTLAGAMTGNAVQGAISGALNIVKTGGGDWTLSGADTYTGTLTVSAGTVTLAGTKSGTIGAITVGNQPGINATLHIQNGTYALGANNFNVGNGTTTAATGTVFQTGGAVSFTSGNGLLIGQNTVANRGIYNMTGGSITPFASNSRGIILGVNSGSLGGTFNLGGNGALILTAASGGGEATLQIGRYDSSAHNTVNLFSQTGGTGNIGYLSMGGNGTTSTNVLSELTLTGGIFLANSFPRLAAGNSNTATILIGGVADVTLPAFPTSRGTGATASLVFDGGTLRPTAASTTYLQGLTSAVVKDGGVAFDVPTGRDITVAQPLLRHGTSTGGLVKRGVGALTLSGVNRYEGSTIVSNGTLLVSATGTLGAGDLSVSDGAICALRNTGDGVTNGAVVYLTGSAMIDLGSGVNEQVQRLVVDGQVREGGVWNATRDTSHFTGTGNLVVSTGLPTVPSGVTATDGISAVTLGWSAATDATGYIVRRATSSSGPYAVLGGSATPGFSDATGEGWVRYWYVVAATNIWGASADSTSVFGRIISGDVTLTNTDVFGSSSFNTALNWISGEAPKAGLRYKTSTYTLRTPATGNTSFTFAGDQLALDTGGWLMYKGSSGYTITVPQLVLNGGTIRIANDNTTWTLQGNATIQTASRFSYGNNNANTVLAAGLSGAGGLSTVGVNLTETLALTGNNAAWSGGMTFNGGGKLAINSGSALGTGLFSLTTANGAATLDNTTAADVTLTNAPPQRWAGDFTFTGTRSLNLGLGPVTLASNRVITVSSNTLTVGGSIGESGGSYGLTKAGTGSLLLAASNSFNGTVTVSAGELRVNHASGLGSALGQTTVGSNGRLSLGHMVSMAGETVTVSGGGSDFNGALQVLPDSAATWAGPVILGDTGARIGAGTNGVLTVSGAILGSGANQALGLSAGRYGRGTVILAGTGSTYTGVTSIVRGTLKLGRTDAASTNAVLDVDSSNAAESSIFDLAGFSQTVGGLRRSGASDGWGIITNSEVTASILTVNQADTSTFSGTIAAGALALVKSGSGTLTLSGSCAFSGGTTISNGTLKIASAGALSTNSAVTLAGGHLDIAGGSPVAAPATVLRLACESGNVILSTSDRLNITGNLSGALVVSISDPESLNVNQVYVLATYGGSPPASVMLSGLDGWIIRAVNHEVRLFRSKGTLFRLF